MSKYLRYTFQATITTAVQTTVEDRPRCLSVVSDSVKVTQWSQLIRNSQ